MANTPIDTRIKLDVAMGVTKGMTPQEVSARWQKWSSTYPIEKDKLSPAVVAALDLLEVMTNVYTNLQTVIKTVESVVSTANQAYKIGLSLLPGIGAVDAAKSAAELAMSTAKTQIATAIQQIYQIPITLYTELTNIKVDEEAKI